MKMKEFARQISQMAQLLEADGGEDVDVRTAHGWDISSIVLEDDGTSRDHLEVILICSTSEAHSAQGDV